MDRAQKKELVSDLNKTFTETSVVVVTRNLGLTVAQSTQLRVKMREAGASYKVSKNRLARIAIEGTPYVSISDMLVGPTALSTSPIPSRPPRWWSISRRPTTSWKSWAGRWATRSSTSME